MPCSTIWPTETKFFVIVGTCKTFFDAGLLAFFPEWDIADVPNGMQSVVSGLYVAGKPLLVQCHVVQGARVYEPCVFGVGGACGVCGIGGHHRVRSMSHHE